MTKLRRQRTAPGDPAVAGALETAFRLHQAGRLADAEPAYRAVLALEAAHADALGRLGLLLHQLGRHDEAAAQLAASIAADPRQPVTWSNYGMVLAALGRHAEALAAYDRALVLAPRQPSILANRGNALTSLGRAAEALASYDKALAIAPDHVNALYNRGSARLALRQPQPAIADFDRVLARQPDFAAALNNRANARRLMDRLDLAVADYERAAGLAPRDPEVLSNLGTTLHGLNRHGDAIAALEAAIARAPQHALAHYNLALVLLHLGEFRRGWQEYEWRWGTPFFAPHRRPFAPPQWRGEEIAGSTVLLHAEQGFGDTIQFLRYAPEVAARGARVVVETPPELAAVTQSIPGVDTVVVRGQPLPSFDFHCPLLSLPLAFGTEPASIPATTRYLAAPPDRFAPYREAIDHLPGPRIGLVWSGRPTHDNDAHRSIPFAAVAPLFESPGSFVSLQTEIRETDRDAVAARPELVCLPGRFADFADTAAAISQLDAVVTVDTSVAHLAGALGKPVFVLLPWASDFRWLLNCQDSPWYPTARLFRQPAPGDWASVIADVAAELSRPVTRPAT